MLPAYTEDWRLRGSRECLSRNTEQITMNTTSRSGDASSLGHVPKGAWAFDSNVTAVFDDMLKRSIPEYDAMRNAVLGIGCKYVQPGTHIVDLGCSRGDALSPFVAMFGDSNSYVGVEVSEPMIAAARERFTDDIEQGLVSILDLDLRDGYPKVEASLTLSVLSLQFVPIDHRQRILRDAFEHTAEGGALILVEKILGASAGINKSMIDIYHAQKRLAGYSVEEVERKRMALEGVLVPMTSAWNEDLLGGGGFSQIDCFWRWMNFAGWIAIK
jgi:tRNA (cmo5U34)-methyltransferase